MMTKRTPPSHLITTPDIAWPTLCIVIAVYGLWALGASIGSWPGFLMVTLAAFWSFTPMHDASHGSVSRRYPWINTVVGYLSSFVLIGPFPVFKYLHLTHHRFTNEEGKDPDIWAGQGPTWQLPFRWVTQEAQFYYWYFRHWDERPQSERLSLFAILGGQLILIATFFSPEILLYWVIPAKIATTGLAFGFDYLPHQPHRIAQKDDRYRASHIIPEWYLSPIFLYQNYHLIHHLYPGVPFYGYTKIWHDQKDFLISKGTKVMRLFPN